ncbi:CADD family putative folate metabolism protein [bacterium]|nr:CADD family putative folate metabolism protein [bacterium]
MPSFLSRLDQEIAKKPLLKHCFYLRWQDGQVSLPELQGYAKEYYPFEREFPCFVSAIHSRSNDPSLRKELLENLVHEERGEKNHRALWLQFAEGLGVDARDCEEHFHSDETEHLLRVFRKHTTSENPIDGLAALYAYERQQPEVAGSKIDGLVRHYDVTSDSALEFFRTHMKYDVEHAQTEGDLLARLCRDGATQARAQAVVAETCSALYEFLDGVERRYQA